MNLKKKEPHIDVKKRFIQIYTEVIFFRLKRVSFEFILGTNYIFRFALTQKRIFMSIFLLYKVLTKRILTR